MSETPGRLMSEVCLQPHLEVFQNQYTGSLRMMAALRFRPSALTPPPLASHKPHVFRAKRYLLASFPSEGR